MRFLSSILFISCLSACSMMQRSQSSGYHDGRRPVTPSSLREDETSLENKRMAYELGYNPNQAMSEEQLESIDDRRNLRTLERRLESPREKEQYSKVLPWLKDDRERVEFLSIPTVEGRQAWIQQNEIPKRAQILPPDIKAVIDEGDIAVGMPQDLVKKSWGEPQDKEVSGNPLYKNEKWKYSRYVSSSEGFRKENRNVYFEGGKVVGWETD